MTQAQFTIGCDPEVFIGKVGEDGLRTPISAVGRSTGTKAKPEIVPYGAVQVDGMALEINTDPAIMGDFLMFNKAITSVIENLQRRLKTDEALMYVPAVHFSQDIMDAAPASAKELGCEPDFNAWQGGQPNPRPDASTNLRTGAGHIHIGWGKDIPVDHPDHIEICCAFVKTLDLYAGLASVIIDPSTTRRALYGRAGAFRPKSYGVEYRVPSNVWLATEVDRRNMWTAVNMAVNAQVAGRMSYEQWQVHHVPTYNVQTIINHSDTEAARRVLNGLGLYI
jgi:hypothetical protein